MRIELIEIFISHYILIIIQVAHRCCWHVKLAKIYLIILIMNYHFQIFYNSNLIDCFKFSFIEQYSRLLYIFLYIMVSYFTIVTERSFNPVKDLWLGKLYSTNYLILLKHIHSFLEWVIALFILTSLQIHFLDGFIACLRSIKRI